MNDDYVTKLLFGAQAERFSPPALSDEFRKKQEAVMKTAQGQALDREMFAYKMSVLEGIAFSSERGRQVLAKYQADVENLYRMLEVQTASQAAVDQQEGRMREQENRIREQADRLQRQEGELQALRAQLDELKKKGAAAK